MKLPLATSVRYLQITLGLCFCFYFLIVAVNNCLDYQSNFSFVKHVMSMDNTFPASKLRYRSIQHTFLQNFVYLSIIIWEFIIALLMGLGSFRLMKSLHLSTPNFHQSKSILLLGFNLSVILWFYAFIIVGGEWFLMWQSSQWNGQTTAFHVLLVSLLSVLILLCPDSFAAAEETKAKRLKE